MGEYRPSLDDPRCEALLLRVHACIDMFWRRHARLRDRHWPHSRAMASSRRRRWRSCIDCIRISRPRCDACQPCDAVPARRGQRAQQSFNTTRFVRCRASSQARSASSRTSCASASATRKSQRVWTRACGGEDPAHVRLQEVRRAQSQPAAGADDAAAVIRLRTSSGRKYPAKFSPLVTPSPRPRYDALRLSGKIPHRRG